MLLLAIPMIVSKQLVMAVCDEFLNNTADCLRHFAERMEAARVAAQVDAERVEQLARRLGWSFGARLISCDPIPLPWRGPPRWLARRLRRRRVAASAAAAAGSAAAAAAALAAAPAAAPARASCSPPQEPKALTEAPVCTLCEGKAAHCERCQGTGSDLLTFHQAVADLVFNASWHDTLSRRS